MFWRGRGRRGICWGCVSSLKGKGEEKGRYQVRRRQVRSQGGHDFRIRE